VSGIIHANCQSRSAQCRFEDNADRLRRGSLLALDQRGASRQHQQGPFAGLRQGELRGLEWTDYTRTELAINRSIWMSVVNLPKTRASRDSDQPGQSRAPGDSASSWTIASPWVTQKQVQFFTLVVAFRGHWLAVVRVARIPAGARLEPIRNGGSG
jgi:hypothetical protein